MAYEPQKITRLGHLKELAKRSIVKISEVATAAAAAIEEIAEAVTDLFSRSTDTETATRLSLWTDHHTRHTLETEIEGETQTVTLTNTQKQPFNSTVDSPRSIALTKARKNLFYSVETEVLEHTGLVGEIQISDKALNGFKIAYTGSGKSVKLAVRVKGGMN